MKIYKNSKNSVKEFKNILIIQRLEYVSSFSLDVQWFE